MGLNPIASTWNSSPNAEILESLARLKAMFPNFEKNIFVMMRFENNEVHNAIYRTIKETCDSMGLSALRADEVEFHSDLFYNVLTYFCGSKFWIAVFEQIESTGFNPNVSLEVGYIMAQRKRACFLKDTNLKTMPSGLIGKLYKPFNSYKIEETVVPALKKWLDENL